MEDLPPAALLQATGPPGWMPACFPLFCGLFANGLVSLLNMDVLHGRQSVSNWAILKSGCCIIKLSLISYCDSKSFFVLDRTFSIGQSLQHSRSDRKTIDYNNLIRI